MTDLWSFLLQTLTASGVAALLLLLKAMFRDKLPPRWQFGVWGVLALTLLLPAGLGGRYTLVNWPLLVETAKSVLTGEYGSLTRVYAPVPLPRFQGVPETAAEWLYVLYLSSVLLLLARYLAAYIRLRRALRRAAPAGPAQVERLTAAAERYGLPLCPAVEVPGLRSAFLCGVFRPVLALPAESETDSKVALHELLHLKYRDAAWGLIICLFRCIHWCNPLLWYCGGQALGDLEALCDQRVLERLEGEERREYGRILLSMADSPYSRVPGASSMANRSIRLRIESIARFKRYPSGMALVSVCMTLLLAAPVLVGFRSGQVYTGGKLLLEGADIAAAMASARTTYCSTPAGALDAYGKAVLTGNALYRAMCAPLSQQGGLARDLRRAADRSQWPPQPFDAGLWDAGLPVPANRESGYVLYNLVPAGDAYEGLLTVELSTPPEGRESHYIWIGVQRVRMEREGDRWVVAPREAFRTMEATGWTYLPMMNLDKLPARIYEAQAGDFTIQARWQQTCVVESYVQSDSFLFSSSSYDTVPKPDAEFTVRQGVDVYAVYTGDPEKKADYGSIRISLAPLLEDGGRPELGAPGTGNSSGGSNRGGRWGSVVLERDWEDEIFLCGGGGGVDPEDVYWAPEGFAADLYLNGSPRPVELVLLPVEGGSAP